MRQYRLSIVVFMVLMLMLAIQGCGTIQKTKRVDDLEQEISRLNNELKTLKLEKDAEIGRLRDQSQQKSKEVSQLEKAKKELEKRLKEEIGEYKAKLEMTERGLVITFLTEVFFDSGKDVVKERGKQVLQNVTEVLNKDVPNSPIAIEGHTDNEPIKYSGWNTNWELSAARALAVLHYIVDTCHVKPERLSAIGYGEYRPVATNETAEGRQKNRRVEMIILPSQIKKVASQG